MKEKIKAYFGNKKFYKMCLAIMIPIMIQQGIASIASYIDNYMVNSYSENAFIGVSTVNKLTFICFFIAIGTSAGISMFLSQFLGAQNKEKINATIQLSLILTLVVGITISFIIYFGSRIILKRFLPDNNTVINEVHQHGLEYGKIIGMFGILIMLQVQISTCMRSLKKTVVPMIAGVTGVIVNICLNYLLIYGVGTVPQLGTKGAAIATVIAKFLEIIILIVYILINRKYHFVLRIFTKNYLSKSLVKNYFKKGMPSFIDEVSWAIGLILIANFITIGNKDYLQSYNYTINITDLFFVIIGALGAACSVIIGEQLGKSNYETARKYAKQIKGLTLIISLIIIVLMITLSPVLLKLFVHKGKIYNDAFYMILITSAFLLIYSYNHISFYILTAGGDSLRSFLLDFYPTYFISMPALVLFASFAKTYNIGVVYIFLFNKGFELLKTYFYYRAVKKEKWVKNITPSTVS